MKVIVIGSHLCPDTLFALNQLKAKDIDFDFLNLSASFPALKAFLNARETEPAYDAVKVAGGIGIPFFELEDGTKTFDLKLVLSKA
ncbi:MAG: glutaredoxin [Fusobacteriaceae bacterium]|jgi:glutaredoxin-related protein|nr:glutaredoxin [Fusobacteriaceae bacterium]